jgi:hypothetical protein
MWQQVQLDAEQTYIDNEAARKDGIYKVQQIGLVDSEGGQDQYMLVTDLRKGSQMRPASRLSGGGRMTSTPTKAPAPVIFSVTTFRSSITTV